MIKDAQIRGSFGFCLRRHGGRILAGKLDLREERLPRAGPTRARPKRAGPHTPRIAGVNGAVCAPRPIGRRDSRSRSGLRVNAEG